MTQGARTDLQEHSANLPEVKTSQSQAAELLNVSERAMVAARLANMTAGNPDGWRAVNNTNPANLPDRATSQSQAAELLNVSERSLRTAKKVQNESGKPGRQ